MNITVAIDRGGELRITVRDDEIPAAERRLVQTFENALQVNIHKLLSQEPLLRRFHEMFVNDVHFYRSNPEVKPRC